MMEIVTMRRILTVSFVGWVDSMKTLAEADRGFSVI